MGINNILQKVRRCLMVTRFASGDLTCRWETNCLMLLGDCFLMGDMNIDIYIYIYVCM